MTKRLKLVAMTLVGGLFSMQAVAQLSTNPDKFLGNITTGWGSDMNANGFTFYKYWNQVTPENATKWSSVEGTRNSYNWTGADKAYNYAKKWQFPFKFHTLIWGSQFPGWVKNLSVEERYKAIVKWMDAVKKHYPNLEMIDVANEAVEGHQADTHYIKEALGGGGVTGYDWLIKAFEMAAERWPDAILIYNDFNTFQWNTDQFIDLVKTLRNAGAPIDAYGCQSHELTDCDVNTFKSAMTKIQSALKMPMYITEYDIATSDNTYQKQRYSEQIPLMWEASYCAGITLWGWFYGQTWTTDGNSGLIRDGQERPALTWLREYMASDKAKSAKSPFPGMKKEASVYVKPQSLNVSIDEPTSIEVRARLRTKTIDRVELYIKGKLFATMTEAPYTVEYTPDKKGAASLRAVVYDTEGNKYERLSSITVLGARSPYKGVIALPGTLQFENFDAGGEGLTWHDSDATDEGGTKYRTDNGGVDIVTGNSGYAIGYTANGEWLEYTVDVTQAGKYEYQAVVASGNSGAGFTVSVRKDEETKTLCSVSIPQTDNSQWQTYKSVKGKCLFPLEQGQQVLRVTIDGPYGNLDKMTFTCTEPDAIVPVTTYSPYVSRPYYDLQGHRIKDMPTKRVYILNGKKHLK